MHDAIKNALMLAKNRRKYQTGGQVPYGAAFVGEDKIILGSPHGDKIDLPEDMQSRVRDIAEKHGAYYEGTGGDIEANKSMIPEYRGSWDEQVARNISGYPTEYLAPMFSNVEVNKPHEVFEDPKKTIMASILANQAKARYIKDREFNEKVLRDFLIEGSEPDTNFLKLAQEPATKENLLKFFTTGERLMWPENWQEYPHNLGKIAKRFEDARNEYLLNAPPGVYIAGAGHIPELKRLKKDLNVIGGERAGYAEGGVPDDASQEAFLHEQLQGSAPQYDPQGGLETAKSAAQSLAGMTTPGALADAAGYMGGPSALQNLRDQNYFDAALQLAAVVPGVGPLSKAAKLTKEAEEAANIKRYIERSSPNLNFSRRYKTTEKAKETLKPGEKLVHTMIENPPVIPPPTKRAEGGQIDDRLTASVELGQPDEASQEAFLQEQLQDSAPQYTPEEGMLTGKRAGLMAAGFAPGAGITTAAGQFPTAEGGKEPSMAEDWRKGEYLSAGLKGLGAAGDIAYGVPLVGPAVGAAMKAPLVAKLAMAAAPMAKIAGEVAPATEAVSRVTNPIGMYSAAAEAARALPQEKGTLQQMLATMKGVTPEELHWSGVHQAFAGKPTVTREELAKHFEERLPGVSETVLGGHKGWTAEDSARLDELEHRRTYLTDEEEEEFQRLVDRENASSDPGSFPVLTKYHQYQLPGGENYREVVLHTPVQTSPKAKEAMELTRRMNEGEFNSLNDEKRKELFAKRDQLLREAKLEEGPVFKSSHWDQPNVLSHLRMSDRTGPDGEKILHLEELQSDWGQRGRKEGFEQQHPEFFVKNKRSGFSSDAFKTREEAETYQNRLPESLRPSTVIIEQTKKTEGLPPAPYVASPEGKHTLSWVDLGLKRALKEAAEGGYDKLIWTPGPEQAARYDLSKQISKLQYFPTRQRLQAFDHSGNSVIDKLDVKPEQLPEFIGKDVAQKLMSDEHAIPNKFSEGILVHEMRGQDLSVGGEGMKKFYDKIVPSQLQKIVKKLDKDAKVQLGGHAIETDDGAINAHVIQITPKMREAILKGFAAYADGGAVKPKQRNSSHLGPIIERGMKITQKLSVKKGQKPTTTIPKPVKYVPQAKENAEFRKLMAEVDELLEKFKD